MENITLLLTQAIKDLFDVDIEPVLTRPDEQFGDYATNVAMQLAGRMQKPPREIATALAEKLQANASAEIKNVTIAGPGFINITLSDAVLLQAAQMAPRTKPTLYKNKVVVTEYSDPNPFKVLHVGHLYTSVNGYAIGSLFEAAGAIVHLSLIHI